MTAPRTIVVVNNEATTLVTGEAVYVSAAVDGTVSPKVLRTDSSDLAKSSFFGAVVMNIASGQKGFVQVDGILRIPNPLQDGPAWVDGDIIAFSAGEGSTGKYTNQPPDNWGRVGEVLNEPSGGDAFVFINRVVPQASGG